MGGPGCQPGSKKCRSLANEQHLCLLRYNSSFVGKIQIVAGLSLGNETLGKEEHSRVVVDSVCGRIQRLDVLISEVIWCSVGSRQHSNLPGLPICRVSWYPGLGACDACFDGAASSCQRQQVSCLQWTALQVQGPSCSCYMEEAR